MTEDEASLSFGRGAVLMDTRQPSLTLRLSVGGGYAQQALVAGPLATSQSRTMVRDTRPAPSALHVQTKGYNAISRGEHRKEGVDV